MIDWNDHDSIHIARRHTCPVCGRQKYIGRDEEVNAWECIVYTPQHLYITHCGHCGGGILVKAREDKK